LQAFTNLGYFEKEYIQEHTNSHPVKSHFGSPRDLRTHGWEPLSEGVGRGRLSWINCLTRLVVSQESQTNANLVEEYHELYEMQRRRLEEHVQSVTDEKNMWSNAAYTLALKVFLPLF